jgi:hypothetical protein
MNQKKAHHHLTTSTALSLIEALLRPIIKHALTHAVTIQQFEKLAKKIYVSTAEEILIEHERKKTLSQISVMTGIHRKELAKVEPVEHRSINQTENTITRIIGLWSSSDRYRDKNNKPKILSFGGTGSEFSKLIAEISTDITPASALFELERHSLAEHVQKGVRLTSTSYTPREDVSSSLKLLERDIEGIINSVTENVTGDAEIRNLHAATSYDRIRADALPEIKAWLLREGHKFHEQVRSYIAQFDQDINPRLDWKGEVKTVWVATASHIRKTLRGSKS